MTCIYKLNIPKLKIHYAIDRYQSLLLGVELLKNQLHNEELEVDSETIKEEVDLIFAKVVDFAKILQNLRENNEEIMA